MKAYPTKTVIKWSGPSATGYLADGSPSYTALNHQVVAAEMLAAAKAVLPARRFDPRRVPQGWSAAHTGIWPKQEEDASRDGLWNHYEEWHQNARCGMQSMPWHRAMRAWAMSDLPDVRRARGRVVPEEEYIEHVFWTYRQHQLLTMKKERREQWREHLDMEEYICRGIRQFATSELKGGRDRFETFLGVSSSVMYRWEVGQVNPTPEQLAALRDHNAWKNALPFMYHTLMTDDNINLTSEELDEHLSWITKAMSRPECWTSTALDRVETHFQKFVLNLLDDSDQLP